MNLEALSIGKDIPNDFNVVIEIPANTPGIKYELDKDSGCVLVDRFSGVQVVQVEDNGPGIPVNERGLVLQPFYRALGTNVDGSGLGLAIVQEIARRHGGDARVEQIAPQGLRVEIRIR